MTWLTEVLGYVAIGTGFFAITKKEMEKFRLWHLVSSFFYIIYGLFLQSSPLVIAGVIFCIIHIYHLRRLKKTTPSKKEFS